MEERANYLPVLEYLTPEQVRQVNEAIKKVLDTTGFGDVIIRVNRGHPRFYGCMIWEEFEKPEE